MCNTQMIHNVYHIYKSRSCKQANVSKQTKCQAALRQNRLATRFTCDSSPKTPKI